MFEVISIIKESLVNCRNKKEALNYIKINYPEYYNFSKRIFEDCNSLVKTTEDYMTDYFNHNKHLQNVIDYRNNYEIYNIKLDKNHLPLGDVDKVKNAIEKEIMKRKYKNMHSKEVDKVLKNVRKAESGKYNDYGLITQTISYCPKCGQVAPTKHKCNPKNKYI